MASTIRKRATPGIEISQGSKNIKPLASDVIRPQDGVGGCAPRPRKDRAASSRMAWAISRGGDDDQVIDDVGGDLGQEYARVGAAHACAAVMNSCARTCWVALRMTTAKRSQINSPSTQMTTVRDEPMMATTANDTSTTGIDSRVVTMNVMSMSTRPPK